jgi:ABC-type Fe3+ transport system substrate-binding protein
VLFIDWLLGRDGQKLLVESKTGSARKDLAVAPTAKRVVIDVETLRAQQKTWTERWERLLRLGKEVKG